MAKKKKRTNKRPAKVIAQVDVVEGVPDVPPSPPPVMSVGPKKSSRILAKARKLTPSPKKKKVAVIASKKKVGVVSVPVRGTIRRGERTKLPPPKAEEKEEDKGQHEEKEGNKRARFSEDHVLRSLSDVEEEASGGEPSGRRSARRPLPRSIKSERVETLVKVEGPRIKKEIKKEIKIEVKKEESSPVDTLPKRKYKKKSGGGAKKKGRPKQKENKPPPLLPPAPNPDDYEEEEENVETEESLALLGVNVDEAEGDRQLVHQLMPPPPSVVMDEERLTSEDEECRALVPVSLHPLLSGETSVRRNEMIDGKMPISSLVSLVPMDPERIASLLEMDDSGLPHLLRTATDTGKLVATMNQSRMNMLESTSGAIPIQRACQSMSGVNKDLAARLRDKELECDSLIRTLQEKEDAFVMDWKSSTRQILVDRTQESAEDQKQFYSSAFETRLEANKLEYDKSLATLEKDRNGLIKENGRLLRDKENLELAYKRQLDVITVQRDALLNTQTLWQDKFEEERSRLLYFLGLLSTNNIQLPPEIPRGLGRPPLNVEAEYGDALREQLELNEVEREEADFVLVSDTEGQQGEGVEFIEDHHHHDECPEVENKISKDQDEDEIPEVELPSQNYPDSSQFTSQPSIDIELDLDLECVQNIAQEEGEYEAQGYTVNTVLYDGNSKQHVIINYMDDQLNSLEVSQIILENSSISTTTAENGQPIVESEMETQVIQVETQDMEVEPVIKPEVEAVSSSTRSPILDQLYPAHDESINILEEDLAITDDSDEEDDSGKGKCPREDEEAKDLPTDAVPSFTVEKGSTEKLRFVAAIQQMLHPTPSTATTPKSPSDIKTRLRQGCTVPIPVGVGDQGMCQKKKLERLQSSQKEAKKNDGVGSSEEEESKKGGGGGKPKTSSPALKKKVSFAPNDELDLSDSSSSSSSSSEGEEEDSSQDEKDTTPNSGTSSQNKERSPVKEGKQIKESTPSSLALNGPSNKAPFPLVSTKKALPPITPASAPHQQSTHNRVLAPVMPATTPAPSNKGTPDSEAGLYPISGKVRVSRQHGPSAGPALTTPTPSLSSSTTIPASGTLSETKMKSRSVETEGQDKLSKLPSPFTGQSRVIQSKPTIPPKGSKRGNSTLSTLQKAFKQSRLSKKTVLSSPSPTLPMTPNRPIVPPSTILGTPPSQTAAGGGVPPNMWFNPFQQMMTPVVAGGQNPGQPQMNMDPNMMGNMWMAMCQLAAGAMASPGGAPCWPPSPMHGVPFPAPAPAAAGVWPGAQFQQVPVTQPPVTQGPVTQAPPMAAPVTTTTVGGARKKFLPSSSRTKKATEALKKKYAAAQVQSPENKSPKSNAVISVNHQIMVEPTPPPPSNLVLGAGGLISGTEADCSDSGSEQNFTHNFEESPGSPIKEEEEAQSCIEPLVAGAPPAVVGRGVGWAGTEERGSNGDDDTQLMADALAALVELLEKEDESALRDQWNSIGYQVSTAFLRGLPPNNLAMLFFQGANVVKSRKNNSRADEMMFSSVYREGGIFKRTSQLFLILDNLQKSGLSPEHRLLPQLTLNYFLNGVLPDRKVVFKDIAQLKAVGQFYGFITAKYQMEAGLSSLFFKAFFYRPPDAQVLFLAAIKVNSSHFYGLDYKNELKYSLKERVTAYILFHMPNKFQIPRTTVNVIKNLKDAFNWAIPDYDLAELLPVFMEEILQMESNRALEDAADILTLMFIIWGVEVFPHFRDLLTKLSHAWAAKEVTDGVYAAVLRSVGGMTEWRLDNYVPSQLEPLKEYFTVVQQMPAVEDSEVLREAIDYSVKKLAYTMTPKRKQIPPLKVWFPVLTGGVSSPPQRNRKNLKRIGKGKKIKRKTQPKRKSGGTPK